MLNTTKSINVSGSILTTDNKYIASVNASITESGNISINTNIDNRELYEANEEMVRNDIDSFTAYVRTLEDTINATKED